MSDLETRLTEARERLVIARNISQGVQQNAFDVHTRRLLQKLATDACFLGFDTASAVAREVVAEKDAEIARIRTALEYKNTTIERMQSEHDNALETKDAEIARLRERVLHAEDERPTWWRSCGCAGIVTERDGDVITSPCEQHRISLAFSKCGVCGEWHISDGARHALGAIPSEVDLRKVSDAQRELIEAAIGTITNCQRYQAVIAADRVCAILEPQPESAK